MRVDLTANFIKPGFIFPLCIAALSFGGSSLASERLLLSIDVKAQTSGDGSPNKLSGFLSYQTSSSTNELCFYLPYNDKDYGRDTIKRSRFRFQHSLSSRLLYKGGKTKLSIPGRVRSEFLQPYLLKVVTPANETVKIGFESSVPRLTDSHDQQWLYDGFYPKPLAFCPKISVPSQYYTFREKTEIAANITIPRPWQLILPLGKHSKDRSASFSIKSKDLVFGAGKDLKSVELSVDSIKLKILYYSDDFLKLIPTIEKSLRHQIQWYGPFPFTGLTIIESLHLERSSIAGLVAINRPRQSFLRSLQLNWLNWSHWVTVLAIAKQWQGAAIDLKNPDDRWLLQGIAEFTTLDTLKHIEDRYNIFNSAEHGYTMLSFNYRELHDIGATILYREEPSTTLTSKQFETLTPLVNQHPMLSLRNAAALRYLKHQVGTKPLAKFMRLYTQGSIGRNTTPRRFIQALSQEESKGGFGLEQPVKHLTEWWTKKGWPNYQLDEFSAQKIANDQWRVSVHASQLGELDFPVTATIVDENKNSKIFPLTPTDDGHRLTETLNSKPTSVTIDQVRATYDSNRYNNSSKFPDIHFFPGSSNSLTDDGYTVVWVPYPYRRPGRPWSLVLHTGLFRYLNSSLIGSVQTEFDQRQSSSFFLQQQFYMPKYRLNLLLITDQNIYGSRKIEAGINYGPLFSIGPHIKLGAAVRRRRVVGKKESVHQTGSFNSQIIPRAEKSLLDYQIKGEHEFSLNQADSRFRYERRYLISSIFVSMPYGFDVMSRLFRGELTGSGDIPYELLFHPEDVSEALLRLDVSGLLRSRKLYSIGNNLYAPLSVPFLKNSFFLSRRTKAIGYYDFGRAIDQETTYRAAGLGVSLPFGGDITGVGTLALSKLSLLVTLYSAVNREVSREPRVLFTIGGEF